VDQAAIQDYVLRSRSLVRLGTTSNQRKFFFKLRATNTMGRARNPLIAHDRD